MASAPLQLETLDEPLRSGTGTLGRPGAEADRGQVPEASLDHFDALHDLYHRRVFRFLMVSTRNADLAETLTQETFLRAWTTRAQFRGDCSMATWLMRLALNLLRDHTRTNRFRFWKRAAMASATETDLLPHLPARTGSQESHLIAEEQVAMVWETVQELSERQRTVFHLRFVDELELAEIAEVVELPLSTVKTHLYRALAAVRERHAHGSTRVKTEGRPQQEGAAETQNQRRNPQAAPRRIRR